MDTAHSYFPESQVYRDMLRQVLRYVLGRTMGYTISPDYCDNPGELYQVGFAGALDVLRGARSIHVGAEHGNGDVFSPLHAVICADIARHLRKFADGLPLEHSPTLTRELVEPGLATGLYTDQESTLNYRELYVDPKLMFRYDDHASLMAAAHEEMNRLVASHEFALSGTAQAEVNKVFQAAAEACDGA